MANYYWNGHAVQFAAVSAVTAQTAIVAATAAKQTVVLGYVLSADTLGDYLWESASTALTGSTELAADSPVVVGFTGCPVLQTATNEALNLTGATALNGHVAYVSIDP